MSCVSKRFASSTAIGLVLGLSSLPFAVLPASAQQHNQTDDEEVTTLKPIVLLSAEDQLRQAPGVSTITAGDIDKQPVASDLSEIIRKMPGVNLTGTSASGQRGNQRQIDIRGMGPENTLILIDGKPVLSRNSVRMGRAGERDSRGDSNWIPAELVERVEVLRGPAAARYGSGSSGGVVNIITKRPTEPTASVGVHVNVPQASQEGGTTRANVMVAGPLGERLSYRLYGNTTRTDADAVDINAAASVDPANPPPAGREGVVTKDVGGLLSWQITPGHKLDFEGTFSRQGNIFAGDRQLTSTNAILDQLADAGAETNVLYRRVLSVTHRGEYSFGESMSFLQWENTRNRRNLEGLAGGAEGSITTNEKGTITLDNLNAKTEWTLPLNLWRRDHVLTLGAEFRGEYMDDPVSLRQNLTTGTVIPGIDPVGANRDPKSDQWTLGLYAEDNIYWSEKWTITPGLRVDYNSNFGGNVSPSLNASYQINDQWSLKLGVAKAFKAPNLFQLNPNYVYYTMGNGCPINFPASGGTGCYVIGNPDLKAETSINKEIGIAYTADSGFAGGITWFHNDYKNRIASGMVPISSAVPGGGGWVLRWENVPEAVVSGLEGNLSVPLGPQFAWRTNATYMIESENKQNGQPLSLVPDYTINTSLDWYAQDNLTMTVSATHYGETPSSTLTATTGGTVANPEPRKPYTLVNLGLVYDISPTYRATAGITNIFNERIFREGNGTGAGANTFNEPGRAFYIGLHATF